MRWNDRSAACLAVSLLIGACTDVRYQHEGKAPEEGATPFERTVSYRVDHAFYAAPPRCAVILPSEPQAGDADRIRTIEAAVARHLSYRIERVIGPDRRDLLVRDRAVDLRSEAGRRQFGTMERCDAGLAIHTGDLESTWVVVWAYARLGLSLRLVRLADGVELWRASHEVSRSDGSIPFSLIGIPLGALTAGRFQADDDVFPSMADDAARRILASLPDTRVLGSRAQALR